MFLSAQCAGQGGREEIVLVSTSNNILCGSNLWGWWSLPSASPAAELLLVPFICKPPYPELCCLAATRTIFSFGGH